MIRHLSRKNLALTRLLVMTALGNSEGGIRMRSYSEAMGI
jgi:hypothetical protein